MIELLGKSTAYIERHFAWLKLYFGMKTFQCCTLRRVTQFVLLTDIAALAVALACRGTQTPGERKVADLGKGFLGVFIHG